MRPSITIAASYQELVSCQACNPPDPHWSFSSLFWRRFTVLSTKVAPFSFLIAYVSTVAICGLWSAVYFCQVDRGRRDFLNLWEAMGPNQGRYCTMRRNQTLDACSHQSGAVRCWQLLLSELTQRYVSMYTKRRNQTLDACFNRWGFAKYCLMKKDTLKQKSTTAHTLQSSSLWPEQF